MTLAAIHQYICHWRKRMSDIRGKFTVLDSFLFTSERNSWLILEGGRKITKVPVTKTGPWIYIYGVPRVIKSKLIFRHISMCYCKLIIQNTIQSNNYFYYKHNYVFTKICYMFWPIKSPSGETLNRDIYIYIYIYIYIWNNTFSTATKFLNLCQNGENASMCFRITL